MVNVGVMMKPASASLPPPPMLYLPASNLTGPLLRPDGCIHNTNAQQLRKHITLDCNQHRRLGFCVGPQLRPRTEAQAQCVYDANQSCLTVPVVMQALCERAVVL